jgi:hypothetical protein
VGKYGATFFREAVRRYIVLKKHSGPRLTPHQLEQQILFTDLPFTAVPVYHKLKFIALTESSQNEYVTLDAIQARPKRQSKKGTELPSRFDIALLDVGSRTDSTGVRGTFHPRNMPHPSNIWYV